MVLVAPSQAAFVDFNVVKLVAKIGVLLLSSLLSGAPIVACMLPGAITTDEEAACCQDMDSDCGQGDMPSSHSCCKAISAPNHALAKRSFESSQQFNPLYIVPPNFGFAEAAQQMIHPVVGLGHSPPETPPSSTAILRI